MTGYRLREFYSPEYDRNMYIIEQRVSFLFFHWWAEVDTHFYTNVPLNRPHEWLGNTAVFYKKEHAIDIINENLKIEERRKQKHETKIIELAEKDLKKIEQTT